MIDWFLDSASFMPHGYCLLWRPDLVAMHAASDLITALSYFSIPIAIAYVMRLRGDIQFGPVPWLFVSFIMLCGINHVVGLVTMVEPIYGAQAFVKMAMATVSVATAVLVWPLIPKIVAVPRIDQLRKANEDLQAALDEQKRLLAQLTQAQDVLASREHVLRQVVESVEEAVAVLDSDNKSIVTNGAFRKLAPTEAEERSLTTRLIEAAGLQQGDESACNLVIEVECSGIPNRTSHSVAISAIQTASSTLRVFTLTDVTKTIATQHALKQTEQRLWQTINAIPDGFVIYDADDCLVVANHAFYQYLGIVADDLPRRATYEEILRAGISAGRWDTSPEGDAEWLARRMAERASLTQSSTVHQLSNGRWIQRNDRRLETGEIVGLCVDVTEHKGREAELRAARDKANDATAEAEAARKRVEYEARHDTLTELENRRSIEFGLRTYLQSGTMDPFAVLHIDLDGFKQINDTMGHAAGDRVLIEVAHVIRSNVREIDRTGRLGGDEFIIILANTRTATDAVDAAQRIVDEINRPITVGDQKCRVGASIGIALADGTFSTVEELMAASDAALYDAKRAGRNRVQLFGSELKARTTATRRTAAEITRDLEAGRFLPHYQSQICARSGEIVGCEALVRWDHPERGLLSPVEFLEVAEAMDVVQAIDGALLQRVVADVGRWDQQGLPGFRVSINVSGARLRSSALIRDLEKLLPLRRRLSLEVLESISLDQNDSVINANLQLIREMGFEVELDDFGSGHASIVGLTRLKPSRLKIDRRLIAPIVSDARAAALVRSIVDIGSSLDVAVTAEGVETREHIARLRDLGVDFLQGYAIARPLSADRFAGFLQIRPQWSGNDGEESAQTSVRDLVVG